MSDNHYKDGEVVWVKWGRDWWPGEVWSDERVPKDIPPSMRKSVIAFVKFFQEESL
jgi:PWWP domain